LIQIGVSGCSDNTKVIVPDQPTFDEQVYQNCLAVQAAAEAYAEANGDYPYFVCDQPVDWLPSGLIHFLPDETKLPNPRTDDLTEPVRIEPSGVGSTSYRVFAEYGPDMEWHTVGYYIQGRGLYEDYVITNISDPDIHIQRQQAVLDNVETLLDAAREFAGDNQGIYPVNMLDETEWRVKFEAYFLDRQLLLNAYTNERTEPSIWSYEEPSLPGQIAYVAVDANGDGTPDGCRIMAVASYAPYTITNFLTGQWYEQGNLGGEARGAWLCDPEE
jgi:hypothetical protein